VRLFMTRNMAISEHMSLVGCWSSLGKMFLPDTGQGRWLIYLWLRLWQGNLGEISTSDLALPVLPTFIPLTAYHTTHISTSLSSIRPPIRRMLSHALTWSSPRRSRNTRLRG